MRLSDPATAKPPKNALLNQPDWREIYDGRTSQAMLDLLFRLRELRAQYPALRVATIVDLSSSEANAASGGTDEAMGHSVLALKGEQPENLVLVLTGNIHGMKNPILGYKTAAMYLPADQLISLQVTDTGGEAWTMKNQACGASHGGIMDKDKAVPSAFILTPVWRASAQWTAFSRWASPLQLHHRQTLSLSPGLPAVRHS